VSAPTPPAGLGERGSELWSAIVADYDLETHELTMLLEAARTVDLLERLEAEIQQNPPLMPSSQGMRANPAAVEARAQRLVLARLLVALRIPTEDAKGERRRTQRRGIRGVYSGGLS
jgi:hypothetical protein